MPSETQNYSGKIMTIVKWIGIALLTPILLIISLILLMNWNLNWARDIVTQEISELTHRKLTVAGEVHIDWSLVPTIRIEQIQFENAAWSKEPNMLALAALDVRVDLIELFKGRVILPEIILNIRIANAKLASLSDERRLNSL